MESIKSLQDNPFFKHFGIKHNTPAVTRSSWRAETDAQTFRQSSFSAEGDDDIGEYHPMSGFVHKLKDKFSSLGTKEEYSSFRRSSSLDELSVENEVVTNKLKVSAEPGISTSNDKFSDLSTSKLSYKAKSIEGLNHAHHKPQKYFSESTSPQHTRRHFNKGSQLSGTKFQGNLDLARDDIIIIEKTPSSPVKGSQAEGGSEHDGPGLQFVSGREIISRDELPKPNTVLTVRSIFESASSAASLYSRKPRSDLQPSPLSPSSKSSWSPLQADVTISNQDSVSKRGSVQNSSPLTSPRSVGDTYTKPVSLPGGSTFARASDYSKRLSDSYKHEDLKSPTSNISVDSGADYSKPVILAKENIPLFDSSSSVSRSATASDSKSSNFEHSNIPDATKSSSSQYSLTSTRSTASVRPTFSSKQNATVKPVPLSPPASTTTSYQRSRPVVSVAPYKDKPENKDDGQPVMIFSKTKLSEQREKAQISSERTQSSNLSADIKDQEIEPNKDTIPLKEAKKVFQKDTTKATYEPNNKLLSHGKRFSDENNKNSEKIKTESSRIIQTNNQTTIEIRSSLKDDADREPASLSDRSNKMETDAAGFNSVRLVAASSTGLTAPRRMAPEPPAQLSTSSVLPAAAQLSKDNVNTIVSSHQTSHEGLHQETRKDQTTPGKRLHPKDTAVSNEQPVKKVIKDKNETEDRPVKGIPSIITQRLKQQSSNPSAAADVVVSSSDVSASSLTNIYSRTMLSHVSTDSTKSLTDNTKQDTLSSEIETEIAAVRRKMDANKFKSSGPAQIFDSSQLTKKKKESQKLLEPSDGMVPQLDLSSITADDVMEYQPQMRKIKPCNIIFIGENAKTSRSLLDKKRTVKISIHFSNDITETFEYPSEDVALENYLQEHPLEKEEILILEDFSGRNGESEESSDDVEIDVYLAPAGFDSDSQLKSNTGLAHSGSLQSYRGRFQQEYEFGAVLPDQPTTAVTPEPEVDPDKQMLRPSEEDTNTWSTSDSSDLLF